MAAVWGVGGVCVKANAEHTHQACVIYLDADGSPYASLCSLMKRDTEWLMIPARYRAGFSFITPLTLCSYVGQTLQIEDKSGARFPAFVCVSPNPSWVNVISFLSSWTEMLDGLSFALSLSLLDPWYNGLTSSTDLLNLNILHSL